MSKWLIGLVTVIYLGTAVSFYIEKNKGMAIVFFGYALANIGLIVAA